MKKTNYLLLMQTVVVFFVAWYVNDGAVSPVASTRAKGPKSSAQVAVKTGIDKTTGGSIGAIGTAGLIYFDWITPPSYARTTIFATNDFSYNINSSKLSQTVLDRER
jgi:hypothetical protein